MLSHKELANAIRILAIDGVQRANSGHPGMPMGMADIAETLWNGVLKHDPATPDWHNRDRFVLSNGHGSMLLYALLHLTGYDLSLDDIKQFRQLGSKTPGHPEYGMTPGVETTTGPLGQGLANAVGMALAEKTLAAHFNRPDYAVVDHHTYAFVGDGCLMEGISHEACSLAGTLELGKLIVLFDDNGISIDGDVTGWFTENVAQRFASYHWHVVPVVDGHDHDAVLAAIKEAKSVTDRPSLICCQTTIGYGSPSLAGTAKTHGSPLGQDEIAAVRKGFNWPHAPFDIPASVYDALDGKARGVTQKSQWDELFEAYRAAHPELAAEFLRRVDGQLPADWPEFTERYFKEILTKRDALATRKSSQACLEILCRKLPELLGGSADLTGSNCTNWSGTEIISADLPAGNYIEYGVREFAMSAMMNGITLHGGFIPYGGTFLVFTDYARNAVRLAAMMKQRVIFVYTHDSIALGEDGPTHQPVEHAAILRLTPGVDVWRPADNLETAVAWEQSITREDGPSCLLLSRQNLPQLTHDQHHSVEDVARGGYILYQQEGALQGVLLATGSEVELAINVAAVLQEQGLNFRVVSMPCCDRFLAQDEAYQAHVLPKDIPCRISIEAATTNYWRAFVGDYGTMVGLDQFGESGPAEQVLEALGFTVEAVVAKVQQCLQRINEEKK